MKKWNIGTKIWFGFYILTQWLMFIEFATKPITATNAAYQQATAIYGVSGAVMTALILWLAITHKRIALNTLLILAVVGALVTIFTGGFMAALLGLILPAINWLIVRNGVE